MIKRKNKDSEKIEENVTTEVIDNNDDLFSLSKDESSDSEVTNSDVEITYEDSDKEYLTKIEDAKKAYLKAQSLNKWLSFLVMGIVIAIICVAFFVLQPIIDNVWTLVIVGLACASLFVYNFVTKKMLTKKASVFISTYYDVLIEHLLGFPEVSDFHNIANGKITNEEFIESRTYIGIQQVGSRNISTFKYKDDQYRMVDLAAQIKGIKSLEAVFVGKVIFADNELDIPGRILISIKGNSELFRPLDDIQGLSIVGENKKYLVYSSYEKYRRLITKSVISKIEKYVINKNLLDVFISIQKGKTIVGLDLDNEIMDLPVDKPFNEKINDKLKFDILNTLEIIDEINHPRGE